MAKLRKITIDPATYPRTGTFGQLLAWHIVWGTRPGCSTTEQNTPWTQSIFAEFVHGNSATLEAAKKNIRNWKKGKIPSDKNDWDKKRIEELFSQLFGDDPNLRHWKADLEKALKQGRRQQAARIANREIVEPQGVPHPTSYFIGRDDDVEALASTILNPSGTCAILVQGGPGIGKTELTKAIAHHAAIATRFGQRRWFVPLENTATAEAMKNAVIRALGCDPQHGFQAVLDMLRSRPALLVLDNLETPWEPKGERNATEAALADLAAVPGVALLASFRGREWVSRPKWLPHPLAIFSQEDAAALFASIAGPWVDEDPVFGDFLTALGGLPLAIELVARRAHGRTSLVPLWAEWNRIGAELARHPDFAEERLTSLPHSIELSLQSSRATVPALRLFSLLGCLPAGLSAQDLTTLMADDAYTSEERLLALGLAVERSGRITLLPPVREHAARRYPPDTVGAPHWGSHFWDMTLQLGKTIGTAAGESAVQRLEAEFANIEACLREMLHRDLRYEAVSALPGLVRLIITRALDGKVLQEIAARCEQDNELLDWTHCLTMLGDIARARARYEIAEGYYKRAGTLYESLQYPLGAANCWQGIARIALQRENLPAARSEYEKLIPIYQRVEDKLGEANCLRALGDIALEQADRALARTFYDRAKALYVELDFVLGQAHCMKGIGNVAFDAEDVEAANTQFTEALALYQAVDDPLGQANCIKSIGDICLLSGQMEQARSSYEEAITIYQKMDNTLGEANCTRAFGDIAQREGKYAEARKHYKDALALYEAVQDKSGREACIRKLEEM